MAISLVWLDNAISRVLRIPPPTEEQLAEGANRAENAFGFSLLFSGVRCILQYALFPFVLPLVGMVSTAALPITMTINIIAIVSLIFSIRRFWQIRYERRYEYLFVAVVAMVIMVAFIVMEVGLLINGSPPPL